MLLQGPWVCFGNTFFFIQSIYLPTLHWSKFPLMVYLPPQEASLSPVLMPVQRRAVVREKRETACTSGAEICVRSRCKYKKGQNQKSCRLRNFTMTSIRYSDLELNTYVLKTHLCMYPTLSSLSACSLQPMDIYCMFCWCLKTVLNFRVCFNAGKLRCHEWVFLGR